MSEELNEIEEVQEEEVKTYDFPEGTIFYQEIREEDGYKWLAGIVTRPETADKYGILENHVSVSDLVIKKGRFYLKGYEKPDETEAEIIRKKVTEIENNVQELIDSTAHQKGYDNGFTCCSYIGSTDSIFHAEAVAFSTWRDQVWRKCYDILGQVQAGEIDYKIVDYDYVLERLPVFTWPE